MSKKSILLAMLMVILAAFVISPHTARAATWIVNTGSDHAPDGACDAADCTLREAVLYAASGDTITFAPTVTAITLGSVILVNKNLTIRGPGAGSLTISGGGTTQIFDVSGGNVSLSGVTLTGSFDSAISNDGTLTITDSTFQGNWGFWAGAIVSFGTLTITNSTFQGNQGAVSGAIYSWGTLSIASTLFSNNTSVNYGDDIYSTGGWLTVSGSCINGNTGASIDIERRVGAANVDNNWWGTALGPNQGVGTTNIPAASWLSSPPVCGPVAGSGSGGADMPPDDRINWRYGDDYVVFYPRQDDQAEPVIHAYCVSAEGQGTLELIVTQDMLDQYPEYPGKPAQNRELFHSDVCRVPFFFYILTTGEYQINVGPDWEGKVAVIIFTGLPPTNIYFYRYNVLDSN